jgi:hypothetical protein
MKDEEISTSSDDEQQPTANNDNNDNRKPAAIDNSNDVAMATEYRIPRRFVACPAYGDKST